MIMGWDLCLGVNFTTPLILAAGVFWVHGENRTLAGLFG